MRDVFEEMMKITPLMQFHSLRREEARVRKVLKIQKSQEMQLKWKLIAPMYLTGWHYKSLKVNR
jgi:hypothetical protein